MLLRLEEVMLVIGDQVSTSPLTVNNVFVHY